jgi:hypothetical protein
LIPNLAINAFTNGNQYSLTDNASDHRWELDLENNINIEALNIWNRIENASDTANITIRTLDSSRNEVNVFTVNGTL